jgi:glycosyl transferase family 2
MKVHLYTLTWNEADILPFFFRHYDPWVDRYVVYDDGSTDETISLLNAHRRVEIREFVRTDPESFVESHRTLQNHVWKESRGRADWVVITAVDEHLHVLGMPMRRFLRRCRAQGATCIPAIGYQMLSDEFPAPHERLCESRRCGAPCGYMNKLSIFDPNAVQEINYAVGRHDARPEGRLRTPEPNPLLLLHYKYLGFERTHRRHQELKQGLGPFDIANKLGHRYSFSKNELRADWDSYAEDAVDIATGRGPC